MEKNYYRLGQISYTILPNDTESFNNMVEWQKKVGKNAFTFTYDDESRKKIRKIVESSCKDWEIISDTVNEYEPDQAMTIRDLLENKKFKTIQIYLQKDIKQITLYITLAQDSWIFVTTYFIYKVPNKSFSRPFNEGEFKLWSAFFCDMEFEDSLSSLVTDLCNWYENQDVIKYNKTYYDDDKW